MCKRTIYFVKVFFLLLKTFQNSKRLALHLLALMFYVNKYMDQTKREFKSTCFSILNTALSNFILHKCY